MNAVLVMDTMKFRWQQSGMQKVPFLSLNFDKNMNNKLAIAASRVIDSGYYINGPEVKNFEKSFADYCRTSHCVGISNGLDALFLAIEALNLPKGSAIAVPANTFIATWLAVVRAGFRIVPIEANDETGQLDGRSFEEALKIHSDIRCLIVVHLYGLIGDLEQIISLCSTYKIKIIEDAAQAHGSIYDGQLAGSIGDVAAFSFYPGKTLGAIGDGGCITTNSQQIDETVRELRNYGSKKKYFHESIGYNHRLDEIQAAFLSEKLNELPSWIKIRQEQVDQYFSKLKGIGDLKFFRPTSLSIPAWHLFVIRTKFRDKLSNFLSENGIETLVHYPVPCHMSGAFEHLGYTTESFPITSAISAESLSLPIGPHVSTDNLSEICELIRTFFIKQ